MRSLARRDHGDLRLWASRRLCGGAHSHGSRVSDLVDRRPRRPSHSARGTALFHSEFLRLVEQPPRSFSGRVNARVSVVATPDGICVWPDGVGYKCLRELS